MKVVFDSQAFTMQEYGGVSRYISSVASHIANNGVDIKIISPLYINWYLKKLSSDNVVGWKIPRIKKTGRIFQVLSKLISVPLVKYLQPDIIHETYYDATAVSVKGAKHVITVYDLIHENYPEIFGENNPTTINKRAAINRADHVICISESTQRDLIRFFNVPVEKTSVIYLGYDELVPENDILSQTDLPNSSSPYLLYVGGRPGYKNFLELASSLLKL